MGAVVAHIYSELKYTAENWQRFAISYALALLFVLGYSAFYLVSTSLDANTIYFVESVIVVFSSSILPHMLYSGSERKYGFVETLLFYQPGSASFLLGVFFAALVKILPVALPLAALLALLPGSPFMLLLALALGVYPPSFYVLSLSVETSLKGPLYFLARSVYIAELAAVVFYPFFTDYYLLLEVLSGSGASAYDGVLAIHACFLLFASAVNLALSAIIFDIEQAVLYGVKVRR